MATRALVTATATMWTMATAIRLAGNKEGKAIKKAQRSR